MGSWEEVRDYAETATGATKASLGPGSKTSDEQDILNHLIIIPLAATGVGTVKIHDGAGDAGFVVFEGGTLADAKPVFLSLGMRAKNPSANASGPRWLISNGANVQTVAVGKFK